MEITTVQYKRCYLVKLIGRLDSAAAPQFADAVNKLMDDGHFRLVMDLGKLEFMSSAGLRVLISAQKNCKRYNRGEVVLAALPKNILAAMELAGFTELFEIYEDVLTAVGNF
jgi:anti-sigma B factor antagonist